MHGALVGAVGGVELVRGHGARVSNDVCRERSVRVGALGPLVDRDSGEDRGVLAEERHDPARYVDRNGT